MDLLHLVGGFIYLLMGADLLVRGAVALARRLGVPSVIVALTVVALGTSLPELVIAVRAAFLDTPGLILGNSVGSNIMNVLVVLGAAALLHPVREAGRHVRRDSVLMVIVSVGLVLFSLSGSLGRTTGLVFLATLVGVTAVTLRAARAERERERTTPLDWVLGLPDQRRMITLFLFAGLVGLPVGARLVVDASMRIAANLGVSDAVVGLTIVAFSTSLPELATTVVAAYRKQTDMAIGTAVGSNILNILAILGVASLISPQPLDVASRFLWLDYPVMVGAALVVLAFVWLDRPIGRTTGALMLLAYGAYLALTVLPGAAG